jgi:PBP1b-binding outer membrane lipoprotein LpoB
MPVSALTKNTLLIVTAALFITGCNTVNTKIDFESEALTLDSYNFKTFDSKDYVKTYKARPDYESIKWGGGYYAGAGCPKLLFNFEGLTKEIIDAKKDFDYVECLGFWNAGMLNKFNRMHYRNA